MTIFTCSIYPPATWLWYQTLTRVIPDTWKILIYDASGLLQQEDYPRAKIILVPNWEHGKKIDHALQFHPDEIFFVMDDDTLLFSMEPLQEAFKHFEAQSECILYSFHENSYHPMHVDGVAISRMGTYAFLIHCTRLQELPFISIRSRPHKENILEGNITYRDIGS